MIDKTIYSIFKAGSKTYFYSTTFFPKKVKKDVFILYSFLRKADDYVDAIPQDTDGFFAFKERFEIAWDGEKSGDVVADSFAELSHRKKFERSWVDAFLNSMEMDITISKFETFKDLKTYLYGSAEVVGLFMAKIMDLPMDSYESARYLGRAMQYMNFIRDIAEDLDLRRTYFPQNELKKHGLKSLKFNEIKNKKDNFKAFIRDQIAVYQKWQIKAEKGYTFIPYRYLVPIKTAADMYTWTGSQIYNDPFIVYQRKVKPGVGRILSKIISNSFKSFNIDEDESLKLKQILNKNYSK